jgi:hypothetical protein
VRLLHSASAGGSTGGKKASEKQPSYGKRRQRANRKEKESKALGVCHVDGRNSAPVKLARSDIIGGRQDGHIVLGADVPKPVRQGRFHPVPQVRKWFIFPLCFSGSCQEERRKVPFRTSVRSMGRTVFFCSLFLNNRFPPPPAPFGRRRKAGRAPGIFSPWQTSLLASEPSFIVCPNARDILF